jgi:CHAD domain-containing protein
MKTQAPTVEPVNPIYGFLHQTIDEALEQLAPTQPIVDENIHNARKLMKKSRAELRLLRPGMRDAVYRKENARLRDAGRVLSPIRDARSLIDALDSICDQFDKELEGVKLAPLEKKLHSNLAAARRNLHLKTPAKSEELQSCSRLLEKCLSLAKKEHFATIDSRAAHAGLKRIYRQGQDAFVEARTARTTEALHEFRKQIKYLFNAIDGLTVADSDRISKVLKRADRLGELLGNDHELVTLSQETSRENYSSMNAAVKSVHALIEQKRIELQNHALKLGEKIYHQKPRKFAEKVLRDAVLPSPVRDAR